jgi:2-dehydro-3-deoxy-D-gluconate 5-dehydrogenase
MQLFDLSSKTAVVTGVSGGLGRGIALGLAEAGADLVCISQSEGGSDTARTIEEMGRRAVFFQADLSAEAALPDIAGRAIEALGRIDILVNNAGMIRRSPAADHAAEDWHDVIALNMNSVFFLSQLIGRHMLQRGSGKMINIASMLSFQGGINVPGYTASKHAVAGITKALANEWAGRGVQVNAIAPGYMATDNTAPLRADEARSRSIVERIPAGRWGTPEDLKGPAIFLASSASDYISGHVLCVDGGWMTR